MSHDEREIQQLKSENAKFIQEVKCTFCSGMCEITQAEKCVSVVSDLAMLLFLCGSQAIDSTD